MSTYKIEFSTLFDLKAYTISFAKRLILLQEHIHIFDAAGLNSEIYFYKLTIDGFTETRKMNLVK